MGDLLIEAIEPIEQGYHLGKSLLVETHSEHIILRLLRRIRETSENNLYPGVTGLEPELLAVVYVEGSDDGVRFRSLRVDRDGEFLDNWPKGFFEERADELF
jgi:predicted ATPase